MQKYTIENEGLFTYLTYHISDMQDVDSYGMGVLLNSPSDKLLPALHDKSAGILKYDISDMTALSEYLKEEASTAFIIEIFETVVSAVNESEKYLLDISMFDLDFHTIFIGKNHKDVQLLYLPVYSEKDDTVFSKRINELFRDILSHARYSQNENGSDIIKLFNYINGSGFSVNNIPKAADGIKDKYMESEYSSIYSDNCQEENYVNESAADMPKKKVAGISRIKSLFGSFLPQNEPKEEKSDFIISEDTEPVVPLAVPAGFDTTGEIVLDKLKEEYPYLLSCSDERLIVIDKPLFCIGKEERYADYRITDNAAVSRMHAEISVNEDGCFVCDQDSTNHTMVNGRILEPYVVTAINDGDIISFADDEYEFHLGRQ